MSAAPPAPAADARPRGLAPRLAWLASLYVVQGLPFGFQATALPAYLRETGVSLTEIGFLDLLALPWLFKALWAPAVDRFHSPRLGRRRSWILPLQLLLALVALAAAFAPPDRALGLLLGLVFSANLVAATLDIAVDGLAVDLLEERHLGLGNTAQVVGFKVGMLLGGGLLVWLSGRIGWRGLFGAIAALTFLGWLISLTQREPRSAPADVAAPGALRRRLKAAFLNADAAKLLVVVGTYKVGEKMADAMYGPFLVDAGYTPAQLGLWLGTWGMGCSLAGSVVGGLLASRLPLRAALLLTAALRVLPHGGQCWLAEAGVPGDGAVIGITCAEAFFGGALTTVMFATMMSRVDRRIGATHYTVLASVEVLGKAPAGPIAGLLGDARGFGAVFAAATLISALYLLVPFVFLRRKHPA